MKKIIFLLSIFFANILSVFANNVEISIDKDTVKVGEQFTVTIQKTLESQDESEFLGLEGMQDFEIFSRSQSTRVQIVNQDVKSVDFLQLGILANTPGEYEIGPAKYKIGDTVIETKTLKLLVASNDQTKLQTFSTQNTQENTGEENQNTSEKSRENTEDTPQESIDSEFQESKNLEISISKFSFLGIGIVLFFAIFYYFLTKYLKYSQQSENVDSTEKHEENIENISNYDFLEKLEQLSQDGEFLEKQEFYTELNIIYREYFEFLGVKNAFTKTLEELKNENISGKLFSLFEKSYFEEFNQSIDSSAQRKQMIMNFMLYLK